MWMAHSHRNGTHLWLPWEKEDDTAAILPVIGHPKGILPFRGDKRVVLFLVILEATIAAWYCSRRESNHVFGRRQVDWHFSFYRLDSCRCKYKLPVPLAVHRYTQRDSRIATSSRTKRVPET